MTPKAPAEQIWNSLAQAFSNSKHRPPKEVLELVKALVASPDFKQLDPKKRQAVLVNASGLAFGVQQPAEALQLMMAATEVDTNSQPVWLMRLRIGQQLKSSDAAIALTSIAERWPAVLRELPDPMMHDVVAAAHRRTDPHELALLEALYAARWTPSDPLESSSDLWRDLALLLIKAGHQDRALVVIRDISDPYTVISMRADRRFDALAAAATDRFDVDKTAEVQLEDLQVRAEAADNQLEIINGEAVGLLRRNRAAEARALTDQLLGRIQAKSGTGGPVDADSEAPWTRTYRAYALRDLGREDEALEEMRRAAHPSHGESDSLQTVNLMEMLYEAGRPNEALEAAALLPDIDGEARMIVEQTKACAFAQKGARDRADEALAYLRGHESESLDALVTGLLCANDQDGVARLIVRRLGDESLRAETLAYIQQYALAKTLPAFVQTLQGRRSTILQRSDVLAAVQAVGRIDTWPLQPKTY